MVMAAGLGTRLRPITWEIPKPVVPVCNRPIAAHLVQLLAGHGFDEVIANLHWFPDTVKACIGDGTRYGAELSYTYEENLLGTAGGVRGVSDFLSGGADDVFVVLAGDALTDVDLADLVAAHRANGGLATLAVKQVADVSQYGVIVTDGDGRIQGFQEKPDPAEALSDLVNCMVYAFSSEIFDYFPDGDPLDFATDVFPALLSHDVPFHVHRIDRYWNDIGTLPEYVNGNLDALGGRVAVDPVGELVEGEQTLPGGAEVSGPVLIGPDVEIGPGANLVGPLVLGAGSRIGAGARLREGVLLPGAEVAARGVFAHGIAGGAERLASGDW
jgi:mannose-1-phosphate guanylyltransferase